jgi:predicted alpha/beta hydrolase
VTSEAESIEIRTPDGRRLGARIAEPRGRRILGTAVFAHPMFANKSVFERPRGEGIARLFLDAGWRTLAFDFRGHGESTYEGARATPEARPWTYDDLVKVDLPAVVGAAQGRWPRSRAVLVGHSLGGHAGLAAVGAGHIAPDALVVAGANVWMRHLEPSRRMWLAKMATIVGMASLATKHRYFPVRALRLGTDDEASPYMDDLARFAYRGRWTSRDDVHDYEALLASLSVPVFSMTSAGDRFYCRTECAERMLVRVPGCTHHVIHALDDGDRPPGHMAMLTDGRSRGAWLKVLEWLAHA